MEPEWEMYILYTHIRHFVTHTHQAVYYSTASFMVTPELAGERVDLGLPFLIPSGPCLLACAGH